SPPIRSRSYAPIHKPTSPTCTSTSLVQERSPRLSTRPPWLASRFCPRVNPRPSRAPPRRPSLPPKPTVRPMPPTFHVSAPSTAVAGLAVLSPGQSATVARTATAPIPAAKADGETDATYLSRLSALDRTALLATVYATGTAGVGQLIAPQQLAKATLNVPVVS